MMRKVGHGLPGEALYQYSTGDIQAWPRKFLSYLAKSEDDDPAISISDIAEDIFGMVDEATTAAAIPIAVWQKEWLFDIGQW